MNKLILFLLISGSALCHAANAPTDINPRNTLITAIARSDFGTTKNALNQITDMTESEKQQYLQMADQIIFSNIMWFSTHAFRPEIGKDLLQSIGYFLGTLVSGGLTVVGIGILLDRLEFNRPVAKNISVALVLAGITSILGYKTIQQVIAAWQNPTVRLENSLRIRDAIFHHNTQMKEPEYTLPLIPPYAVGSNAMALDLPKASEPISYNLIGYESYALGSSAIDQQIEQTEE